MSSISIDIELDDILFEMSSRQKQMVVDELYDDGYVPSQLEKKMVVGEEFNNACRKLIDNSWRLTREEEEFIISLARRIY